MKTTLIILGVIALLFIISQVYTMSTRSNIESYPYKVLKTYDKFEMRSYEYSLFTSVKLQTGDYGKASSQGFSALAGYIFGGNETNEKIAMTSPVAMSLEDSMTVMFMVPKQYDKDKLPKPNQSAIEFREEPAKKMAVVTFGGWANSDKIEKYKNELTAALAAEGIAHTDDFFFFGYNPPYELINRKNEVAVELK
jgi:hypothetical protein